VSAVREDPDEEGVDVEDGGESWLEGAMTAFDLELLPRALTELDPSVLAWICDDEARLMSVSRGDGSIDEVLLSALVQQFYMTTQQGECLTHRHCKYQPLTWS
jgi:hypothetical protein